MSLQSNVGKENNSSDYCNIFLTKSKLQNVFAYYVFGFRGSETRGSEIRLLAKFAYSYWISGLRTSHTRFFILLCQDHIHSKTRNSLISAPERSHVIFASKKPSLLGSKLYTKYIRLNTRDSTDALKGVRLCLMPAEPTRGHTARCRKPSARLAGCLHSWLASLSYDDNSNNNYNRRENPQS